MGFEQILPAKFGSLHHANYFDHRSITVQPGKNVIWTPVRAEHPSKFIDGGLTHVAFNDGQVGNGIPAGKRAVFIPNPDFLKIWAMRPVSQGGGGGKPLVQFTEADCQAAVALHLSHYAVKPDIVTTGSSETNPGNTAWDQQFQDAPNQYRWIDRAWATQMAAYGGSYYGDYDGHARTGMTVEGGDAETLRAGYLTNQAAWQFMYDNTPFGNPFFTHGHREFRHGLVKTYWDGSISPRKRLFTVITDLRFSKNALAHLNSDKRIMSYPFPGKAEFINRQERYERDVPAGGRVRFEGFPQYSHKSQLAIGYISMAEADDIFMWESTLMYGTDPNVITSDNFGLSYTGSGATRVPDMPDFDPNRPAPFPTLFLSGHNAMLTGIEYHGKAVGWAGPVVGQTRYKRANGQWSTNGKDALLDAFIQNGPYTWLHKQGSRRACFWIETGLEPGQTAVRELDLDGAFYSQPVTGGHPYLIIGEV